MSSVLPIKMLVYGTLMQGYSNHYLIEGCKFLGRARTVQKFGLFVADYPFVSSTVRETQIIGEVYEVNHMNQLFKLDELEGHPDYYLRSDVDIVMEDCIEKVQAQIYFNDKYSTTDSEYVSSGHFKDSRSSQYHRILE